MRVPSPAGAGPVGDVRVMVLDDDDETREVVGRALSREGFVVDRVADAAELEATLANAPRDAFALLVLDVMLGEGAKTGVELCRELRARGVTTPVLFLSARGAVHARVEGLEAGADDYLAKPFAVRELVLRVRALARRGGSPRGRSLAVGALALDFDRRTATANGAPLPVTAREWDVLVVLAMAEGRVVTTDGLLERVWGTTEPSARASLEVIVSRIRRKLEPAAGTTVLRTIRGTGYALGSER